MVTADELKLAMQTAEQDAGACTKFCRLGATRDEQTYTCWHNGLGPSDSAAQVVYNGTVLALSETLLAARIAAWLTKLHKRERVDINEMP